MFSRNCPVLSLPLSLFFGPSLYSLLPHFERPPNLSIPTFSPFDFYLLSISHQSALSAVLFFLHLSFTHLFLSPSICLFQFVFPITSKTLRYIFSPLHLHSFLLSLPLPLFSFFISPLPSLSHSFSSHFFPLLFFTPPFLRCTLSPFQST